MADETKAPQESPAAEEPVTTEATEKTVRELRLWPGVLAVCLLFAFLFIPTTFFPESPKGFMPLFFGMMGSYALFFLWWTFASRIAWSDRLVGLVLLLGGMGAGMTFGFHSSLRGQENFMNNLFMVMPWFVSILALTMLVTKPIGWSKARWVTAGVTVACLLFIGMVRFVSADSSFVPKFQARWTPTQEELVVASQGASRVGGDAGEATAEAPPLDSSDWPGFRGPLRDGHVLGGALAGDWNASPPKEIWRRPVGPGWSSFAVVGDRAFTQEQRGDEECVVAYSASTGQPLWSASVKDRFYNSAGGAGPRATPTYHAGALYTVGAAGAVQRLNPTNGKVVWQRFLLSDEAKGREGVTSLKAPPVWGFSSSPLIVEREQASPLMLVYANAPNPGAGQPPVEEAVIAFDSADGKVVWKSGVGVHCYSSPHLATLHGVEQVLSVSDLGLESLDPITGKRLWFFSWRMLEGMNRNIQPLLIDNATVVLSAGYDSGTMIIDVALEGEQWSAKERWSQPSHDLEPYFNDMVLYQDHLYGISKKFLVCVELTEGHGTWPRKVKRKSKVGNGQLVLDEASGRLLVCDENSGEVLLVSAQPDTLNILARFEALTPDVNWNHPVIAGGRLYVRHNSEAACYELP